MGYILQNKLEVSIFIDDVEYPLGDTNQINFLHMMTTATTFFPTCCFQIVDNDRLLDKIGLQDGIPLRIVLKAGQSTTQTYKFRLRHAHKETSNPVPTYTIDGYIDSPRWYTGTTNRNIRGTVNDVLQFVANACGFKYDGITTNDSQLWTPQNTKWHKFVKECVLHSYVNPTSCMCVGLDLDGTLLLRDINNLTGEPSKIIAYQYAEDALTAVNFANLSQSGFNNAVSGYWNTRIAQSTAADQAHTVIDQLQFKSDSRSPLYNTAVKDQSQAGHVRFSPIDVGNNHPNFEQASYQNTRFRNLFSMGQQLHMIQQTNFRLFDRINFSVQRVDGSQDVSSSGEYSMSGRVIYIQGTNYAEKLIVSRHGVNTPYVQG